ncbi:MAG: hypothetical protein JWO89_195 [Verrucomicrobiaceae bacterium]|nr:hypothetical protein [Verrucomicrobiaceae bacterium]MDB6116694.1 hypothetical protein [Verrucomicrobiaceae bacterium]
MTRFCMHFVSVVRTRVFAMALVFFMQTLGLLP